MRLASSLFAIALSAAVAAASAGCSANVAADGVDDSSALDADREARVAAVLDTLKSDRAELTSFLRAMPKGGDLHHHLSGASYAENLIGWARNDGLCIDPTGLNLVSKSKCTASGNQPLPAAGDDREAVIVRAWSMEGFVPGAENGHDHFFAAFNKFGLAAGTHTGDMLAEVTDRAAAQHALYVETMLSLTASAAARIAGEVWGATKPAPARSDFAALEGQILAHANWPAVLADASRALDDAEKRRSTAQGCGTPSAHAGCDVTVRYLFQVTRTRAPHEVFAGILAARELAKKDARVVGVNLSAPEDNEVALRDYALQMEMLDFLHEESAFHVALHAGELTSKFLPAGSEQHLKFHVRMAVEKGHAERIGHGVDILGEDGGTALLAELAQKNVLVEACLSSNQQILEIEGAAHPMGALVAAKVPIALATDDEGISRSDLTREHVRAVTAQSLGYVDLKRMARDSLAHSFAEGASLWTSAPGGAKASACAHDAPGANAPSDACATFLKANLKARLEWTLEERLAKFESERAP